MRDARQIDPDVAEELKQLGDPHQTVAFDPARPAVVVFDPRVLDRFDRHLADRELRDNLDFGNQRQVDAALGIDVEVARPVDVFDEGLALVIRIDRSLQSTVAVEAERRLAFAEDQVLDVEGQRDIAGLAAEDLLRVDGAQRVAAEQVGDRVVAGNDDVGRDIDDRHVGQPHQARHQFQDLLDSRNVGERDAIDVDRHVRLGLAEIEGIEALRQRVAEDLDVGRLEHRRDTPDALELVGIRAAPAGENAGARRQRAVEPRTEQRVGEFLEEGRIVERLIDARQPLLDQRILQQFEDIAADFEGIGTGLHPLVEEFVEEGGEAARHQLRKTRRRGCPTDFGTDHQVEAGAVLHRGGVADVGEIGNLLHRVGEIERRDVAGVGGEGDRPAADRAIHDRVGDGKQRMADHRNQGRLEHRARRVEGDRLAGTVAELDLDVAAGRRRAKLLQRHRSADSPRNVG